MPSQITLPDDTGDLTPITDDHPGPQTDSLDRSPTTPAAIPGIQPEARAESRPEPDYPTDESARPVFALNLSLSQIVGGGLAAATAAALGSKLGLAGTIGGAAMASIVTAVAGSIYTASVRRTHRGVRTALSRRAPKVRSAGPVQPESSDPLSRPDVTVSTPLADELRSARPARVERRGTATRGIVIGALIVFALASVVIFGVERFTGVALDGQHGGTTLGQVTHAGSESLRSSRSPKSAAPADPSPAAHSSDEPSTQPSTDPSLAATTEAGAQPSDQPSDQSSGSSSDPSVTTSQPTSGSTSSGQSTTGQSTTGQATSGSGTATSGSGTATSGSGTATSGSGQSGSNAGASPGN